jgi:hypothetical protein
MEGLALKAKASIQIRYQGLTLHTDLSNLRALSPPLTEEAER